MEGLNLSANFLIGNRFHVTLRFFSPIVFFKYYLNGFKPPTFVAFCYLNIDMYKFELSQKDEIRPYLADSSKGYSKPRAFIGPIQIRPNL